MYFVESINVCADPTVLSQLYVFKGEESRLYFVKYMFIIFVRTLLATVL